MIVLGLNAFGHDAAAVLLVDGEVRFAASEERYDRRRHSAAFPSRAVAAALRSAGVDLGDVDVVAFPWTRGMARARKALWVLRGLPRSLTFLSERPEEGVPGRRAYLAAMRGLAARLSAEGLRAPLVRVPHHLAHAVSATLDLGGRRGAVLTADGMGEWTTAAAFGVDGGTPRALRRATYPHSAGKAYAAVTSWLGFRPEADEGKTMGLAAYGDPDHPAARFTRALLAHDPRTLVRVDTARFDYPRGRARLYGEAFLRRLGPPRPRDEEPTETHRAAARGIQDAIEAAFLDAARDLVLETRAEVLGLAGGLFLNCALNGHLARALDVEVRPFPVAGDAGAAWGAAAFAHRARTGREAAPLRTLRLGDAIDDQRARDALGVAAPRPADLALEVARLVAAGRLVGVARGRAELGPRALGGRSVLASPTTTASRDRLNAHKGREAWRPLAPVVAATDRAHFRGLTASPWMILTFPATDEGRRALPGAVHADGTARVQTVDDATEPFLAAVLRHLATLGQPPVVLNTSLNRRGEPIVNDAAEALAAARAMRLDALALGDYLVSDP